MFILSQKQLIRGCAAHKLAGLGCAADYRASYEPIFAPFDTTITKKFGGPNDPGGWWLQFTEPKGKRIELAHLDQYKVTTGQKVARGRVIAISGNSGTTTSGPHVHCQIKHPNGRRVDPEAYNWNKWDGAEPPPSEEEYMFELRKFIPDGRVFAIMKDKNGLGMKYHIKTEAELNQYLNELALAGHSIEITTIDTPEIYKYKEIL